MKNILVFDTETTGDFDKPLIYDFAYKIINKKGELLLQKNYLVEEIFNQAYLMSRAFYSKKIKEYRRKLETHEIEISPYRKIIKNFINDCRKYKVEIISAYNLAFDIRAINGTMQLCYSEGQENKILEKLVNQKNKKLLCIWNLACDTFLDTDEYRAFADTYAFKTDLGNYKTNAECAYAYLTDNPQFEEEHTALSDTVIEIEILLHIFKNYVGNYTYGLHYGSWQKVQK